MSYILELEPGVFKAPWQGDPGRTLVSASAQRFATIHGARCALGHARKFRPFLYPAFIRVYDEQETT